MRNETINVIDSKSPGVLGAVLAVMAVLVGCWALLVAAGVQHVVLVHAFYLPVVLAAFWLGRTGAVATAVVGGLLAGPLLPEAVIPDTHSNWSWMVRMAFFVSIGGLLGTLLHHLRALQQRRQDTLYAGVTRLYARTLRAFVQALEMKDEETGEHCDRVARNAVTLGERLGLAPHRLEALYWAGYLHDVGKLATPSHLLQKPEALTQEEFAVVQQHTELGADLLSAVSPAFGEIADGVRHHHERWDGRGFPAALAGAKIPLFGRILAVADVFEALTSDRPYRDAMSEDEAATIVREGMGSRFDPAVAEAFLQLVEEDRIHVEARHGRRVGGKAPEVFDPEMLLEVGRARELIGMGSEAGGV